MPYTYRTTFEAYWICTSCLEPYPTQVTSYPRIPCACCGGRTYQTTKQGRKAQRESKK
jgi:rRNA maturation endonuclease Nob1